MVSKLVKICLMKAKTLGIDKKKDDGRIQSSPTDLTNILEFLHCNDKIDKNSLKILIKDGNSKNIGLKLLLHMININGGISQLLACS